MQVLVKNKDLYKSEWKMCNQKVLNNLNKEVEQQTFLPARDIPTQQKWIGKINICKMLKMKGLTALTAHTHSGPVEDMGTRGTYGDSGGFMGKVRIFTQFVL